MLLRLNSFFIIVLFVCFQSAQAQRIVGYYPEWAIYGRNFLVTDIHAEHLTHINYAFANISGGEIVMGDPYADTERFYPGDYWEPGCERGNFHQLRILKQQYPALKTLISVGGWSWSENFSDAAATPASRELFANSCATFIIQHGFDGVDLDWEFPVAGGEPDNVHRPEDGANLTMLCERIRAKLDSLDNLYNREFLLTLAVMPDDIHNDHVELLALSGIADFLNVMTYNFFAPWSQFTAFNSPLFTDPDNPFPEPQHSHYSLSAEMDHYIAGGVPREQINAGMPFYGHGFGNVNSGGDGLYSSFGGGWPPNANSEIDYSELAQNYINMNGYTRYFHETSRVPWLYNPQTQIFFSYDDSVSIAEKAEFVSDRSLGGAMIWELAADRDGVLLSAIYNTFVNANSLPAPQGLTIAHLGDSLSFRWQAVLGAMSYSLWSSTDPIANPNDYTLEMNTPELNAMLHNPTNGLRVYFVRAE